MKDERPYEARVHSALQTCVILLLSGLCLVCAYLEKVDTVLDQVKGNALYHVGFFMTRVYDAAGKHTIFNWGLFGAHCPARDARVLGGTFRPLIRKNERIFDTLH